MSDCAAAPGIFIPPWGEASKGVRAMVMAIRLWADARGSIDCSEAELVEMTGYEAKAVERHMKDAVRLQLVSRSERRRGSDGRLSGYRYWLSGKLNGPWSGGTNCRVDDGASVGVDNTVDGPPDNLSGGGMQPPDNSSETTRHPVRGADEKSDGEGPETKGLDGVPRERARAFPFSNSYFLSFPWRDDFMRDRAGEILAACGPGIGQLGAQNDRVLASLAYVLEAGGAWAEFDHALDVLPVVRHKTGPGRATPLWDFALLTSNLEAHRAKRLKPASEPKAKKVVVAKPAAEMSEAERAQAREARMASLRGNIRLIDSGQRPEFLLPKADRRLSGTWLEDAFIRVRTECETELAALVVQGVAGGDGGGEGGV